MLFRIAWCDLQKGVAITEADIEREQDVEELRRIALAQHAQIHQLIEKLQRKCDTLSFYTGNREELQQTLALIEGLTQQAEQLAEKAKRVGIPKPPKKPEGSGPTPQPRLPHVAERFEIDLADRMCPSCGGGLSEMKPGRDVGDDRRRRSQLSRRPGRAAEVRLQVRRLRRDGSRSRARCFGKSVLARLAARSCSTSTSIIFRSSGRRGSWIGTGS